MEPVFCFHCGLPTSLDSEIPIIHFNGHDRRFCCHGCAAVCQSILDNGLDDFYLFRDSTSPSLNSKNHDKILKRLSVYDRPDVQQTFVDSQDGYLEASLILEEIRCPACLWLNENHVRQHPGVLFVSIDSATQRMKVRWNPNTTKLSDILKTISEIGYSAHPCDAKHVAALNEKRRTRGMQRIIFAGILGMMVMNWSIAGYVLIDFEADTEKPMWYTLGAWSSLFVSTLLLVYPAQDFFIGAWRDLKYKRLGMDIPIVLGLMFAYLGSIHSLLTGQGEVYFDSIAMFVFLVLLARYFETRGKLKAASFIDNLNPLHPQTIPRLNPANQQWEDISTLDLEENDVIRLLPAQTLVVDGIIIEGESSFNESLLTGESMPVVKTKGDEVYSGAINGDQPVLLKVTQTGSSAMLNQIKQMVESGLNDKPAAALMAETISKWFVPIIILLAISTALFWYLENPQVWLPNTIAVLIVTCPCALALATPVAYSVTTGLLIQLGIMPVRMKAIEQVSSINTVVLDKTGTLTTGKPSLQDIQITGSMTKKECLTIAASMSQQSEHPLSRAISQSFDKQQGSYIRLENFQNTPGKGLTATLDNNRWFLGKADETRLSSTDFHRVEEINPAGKLVSVLTRNERLLAVFLMDDALREDADDFTARLDKEGISRKVIMSGDIPGAVNTIADRLTIEERYARMKPEDKLNWVREEQTHGEKVLMFGDGINDAPTLAVSNVSASFSESTDLANMSSDFVFMRSKLNLLIDLIRIAKKTKSIIQQNYFWALTYNFTAVPLAMMGMVPPWVAAIGMSASSLIVVANALRLKNHQPAS